VTTANHALLYCHLVLCSLAITPAAAALSSMCMIYILPWPVLATKHIVLTFLFLVLLCRAALPLHLPQLIPPMQHYHWVLKTCHAGAELDTALTCAQGFVDPDLRYAGNERSWVRAQVCACVSGGMATLQKCAQGFVDPDLRLRCFGLQWTAGAAFVLSDPIKSCECLKPALIALCLSNTRRICQGHETPAKHCTAINIMHGCLWSALQVAPVRPAGKPQRLVGTWEDPGAP
jgi:hypothetical protein